MALDLYVGPVSRYIHRDWKTIGQQAAEAHGIPYVVVGAPKTDGFFGRRRTAKEYERWRKGVTEGLRTLGMNGPLWDDSAALPYVTDRPGWEGLAGLVYKYAHLLHPEFPSPEHVPGIQHLAEDPAYRAATAEPNRFLALVGSEIWLPGNFSELFPCTAPGGRQTYAGSLGSLNAALDEMCELWGKDRSSLADFATDQPGPDAKLEVAALHGLVVFSRLAEEAVKRNLPLILDY